MSGTPRPPELEGFFAAARERRLAFPCCGACGRFHWYPMPSCPHCRSEGIVWTAVAGRAEVFSFTIVRHPFDASRRGALPYTVALVTFADAPGVRLITNLAGGDGAEVSIGDAVEPVFERDGDGDVRVLFRQCRDGKGGSP